MRGGEWFAGSCGGGCFSLTRLEHRRDPGPRRPLGRQPRPERPRCPGRRAQAGQRRDSEHVERALGTPVFPAVSPMYESTARREARPAGTPIAPASRPTTSTDDTTMPTTLAGVRPIALRIASSRVRWRVSSRTVLNTAAQRDRDQDRAEERDHREEEQELLVAGRVVERVERHALGGGGQRVAEGGPDTGPRRDLPAVGRRVRIDRFQIGPGPADDEVVP